MNPMSFHPPVSGRPNPLDKIQFGAVRQAQDKEMPLPGEGCMAVNNIRYFVSDSDGHPDMSTMMALADEYLKAASKHNAGKLRCNMTALPETHPANRALKKFQRGLAATAPPLIINVPIANPVGAADVPPVENKPPAAENKPEA